MPVALRWGKGELSHQQQQQQLQREWERDCLGTASMHDHRWSCWLAFNGSQWRVIQVKLHRLRCFNVVARVRGEDGGLSTGKNRGRKSDPGIAVVRGVWRANEGRANKVLL